jgi:peptidoglycan hydrolase-like protein with peptidoglycan-binding domain
VLVNPTSGHGTGQWQQQMVNRGWSVAVDDMYGDESERVCTQFQEEKGLDVDGAVGPATWAATWDAPVT